MEDLAIYATLNTTCNLACPFCYQRGAPRVKPDEARIQQFLDYLENHRQITSVTLVGGEVMVEPELLRRVLDKLRELNIRKCGMITNGTVYLEWLKDYRDVLNRMQISIDGGEEYHDGQRYFSDKHGSYQAVVRNIRKYQADGFSIGAHGVIVLDKYHKWKRGVAGLFKDLEGLDVPVNFEFAREGSKPPFWKHFWRTRDLYRLLDRYNKRGVHVRRSRGVSGWNSRMLSPCRAGSNFLGYDLPTGRFYACHEMNGRVEESISDASGYIDEEKFTEIQKLQDPMRYKIEKLPLWVSALFIVFGKMQVCWSENKQLTGDPFVIPLHLITLNYFGKKYGKKWKAHDAH